MAGRRWNQESKAPRVSPEFIDEVAQRKSSGQTRDLMNIIFSTNNKEKVRLAAAALGEIGTEEAKKALLVPLKSTIPASAVVWPYVVGILDEGDVVDLLEIEKESKWNARKAAKYKLPEEARAVLSAYLEDNITTAPASALRQLVNIRYKEISDRTFELLLQNDSPEIRVVMAELIQGAGDARKSERRALAAFEEMQRRLPAEQQKKLLTQGFASYAKRVSMKASSLLKENHPRYYIGLIMKKSCLSDIDIRALDVDGRPQAIQRIIQEEMGLVLFTPPTKDLKARANAIMIALRDKKTPEASKALFSLLRKLDRKGEPFFTEEIVRLCRILGDRGERAALPTLRSVATGLAVVSRFAAARAVLRIEGISPYDEEYPLAIQARASLEEQTEKYEEEREYISSEAYAVKEDPDIKMMDRGALEAGARELAWSRDVFYSD